MIKIMFLHAVLWTPGGELWQTDELHHTLMQFQSASKVKCNINHTDSVGIDDVVSHYLLNEND